MAREAFEQRLREFFEEYDQKKLSLVPKIARKLHRHEELLMNHLHHKYNTGKARNVSEEELREEDRSRREKEGEVPQEPMKEEEEASVEEETAEVEEEGTEEGTDGGTEEEEDEEK